MSPLHHLYRSSKGTCLGLLGLAVFAGVAHAQYDPSWTKNFRVGALTGLGMKGQVKLRGTFSVNGTDPGATGVSGVNHVYDDGYVKVDDTGNAGGYTSFWGYESASQYDAGTHSLLMHSASSFSANGSGGLDQDFTVGAEIAYGNVLKQRDRMRLGWEAGLGWLPLSLKNSSSIAAIVNRATYSFDTGGIVLPSGPYNGGSSGIGSTIHDTATEVSNDTVPATLHNLGNLDGNLFTLRLGPTLFYDVSRTVGIQGSLGPAVGFVSANFNYNEQLRFGDGTTANVRGHFSNSDFVFGAYINLLATFHVDDNGDLFLGAQYIPLSSSEFSKDGRSVSLNFTGQIYFTFGVNWIF
ncbi:MAG: hypothetical protein RLY20_784 [Verrucomicrobiota bacterium]